MGSGIPALVSHLMEANRLLKEELRLVDRLTRGCKTVHWLSDDDGGDMGVDSNDVWDFEGNNDK